MALGKGENREARVGFACAVGAYTLWGVLPLLFHGIKDLGNGEILVIRLLVSALFLALLLSLIRGWRSIATIIKQPKLMAALGFAALLVMSNWLIYIAATRSGHVMEASLGYFINPLLNVLLGMAFLGERPRPFQWVAIVIVTGAVVFLMINGGSALWVSLSLAGTFATYGLIRKVLPVSPLDGLAIENLVFVPFALIFLFAVPLSPPASFTPGNLMLLALMGPMTVLPMFLFTAAAQRLQYGTIGLIQYIGPTLQFLAALWLGESFDRVHAIAFGCIWTALAIYAGEGLRHHVRHIEEPEPPA